MLFELLIYDSIIWDATNLYLILLLRYYLIPLNMERDKSYNISGIKLHVYNDHVFTAVHFAT